MKCWTCENEARAVCVFCGRSVCKEHSETKRHFTGFGTKHTAQMMRSETATKIADAIWCGKCRVEYVDTS
jgi:hypothetical protein